MNYELRLINPDLITRAANLRLPILVDEPDKLAKFLTSQSIYLTDRWYRRPVDCGSLNCHSEYQPGSCPQAELVARQVFNLPTHRSIQSQAIGQIIKALAEFRP